MANKTVGTGHVVITDETGEDAAAANHSDADIYVENMAPIPKEKEPKKRSKKAGLISLRLTGAASFGRGGVIYRQDQDINVDKNTANSLLATGLFEEG